MKSECIITNCVERDLPCKILVSKEYKSLEYIEIDEQNAIVFSSPLIATDIVQMQYTNDTSDTEDIATRFWSIYDQFEHPYVCPGIPVGFEEKPKCECGSEKLKLAGHSHWCPVYEKV